MATKMLTDKFCASAPAGSHYDRERDGKQSSKFL